MDIYINDNFPWLARTFLDLPYWVWFGLPLVLAGALILGWVISGISLRVATLVSNGIRYSDRKIDLMRFRLPLGLLIGGLLFSAISHIFPLEEKAARAVTGLGMFITVWGLAWAGLRLISKLSNRARLYLLDHHKASAAALIPLLDKIMKVILVIIATLFLLQNFGFDVVAIITALGIGGIAIALASQKSVENVFGGVMLSLDQPVRVGDSCKWRDQRGTVEDIGLRSTKIRTADRTLISVPNSDLASIQIENFTSRDKMRLHAVLGLRYDTTPDQIRYIISEIRTLLVAHSEVENEPARARFINFNDFSLDIEVFAYIKTTDSNRFLEIREDIFLRIMEIVQDAGSDFAFPTQTVFMERGPGLSKERQQEISAKVRDMQGAHTFGWPNLPDDQREKIQNTIRYQSGQQD